METLVEETKKLVSHDVKDLYDAVIETEKEINWFVEYNEYTFNNPFIIPKQGLIDDLEKLTLNERRKLKKSINIFRIKQSMSAANRFLHYLYKKVFAVDMRVKITLPKKQLLIQNKREIYLKYRLEMEKSLKEYKEEKGDYFKLRLAKGQKL